MNIFSKMISKAISVVGATLLTAATVWVLNAPNPSFPHGYLAPVLAGAPVVAAQPAATGLKV